MGASCAARRTGRRLSFGSWTRRDQGSEVPGGAAAERDARGQASRGHATGERAGGGESRKALKLDATSLAEGRTCTRGPPVDV